MSTTTATYALPIPPSLPQFGRASGALLAKYHDVDDQRKAAILAMLKELFPNATDHNERSICLFKGDSRWPRVALTWTDGKADHTYLQLIYETGYERGDKQMRRLRLTKQGDIQTIDAAKAAEVAAEFNKLAADYHKANEERAIYQDEAKVKRVAAFAALRPTLEAQDIKLIDVKADDGHASIQLAESGPYINLVGDNATLVDTKYSRSGTRIKPALIGQFVQLFTLNTQP